MRLKRFQNYSMSIFWKVLLENATAAARLAPQLDSRMNNLAAFVDMLKQAFNATQNKQSIEQFMGNFVQDLAKMKKVPSDANSANAYRDYQDQITDDPLKASEKARNVLGRAWT
jgi:hypothetical protein